MYSGVEIEINEMQFVLSIFHSFINHVSDIYYAVLRRFVD